MRRIPLPLTSILVAASIVGARPSPSMAPVPVTTSVAASAPVTHVAVVDWGFRRPSTVTLGRGGTVVFDFEGPSHHTATDSSGLGLYDSGSVGPGGPSISFTFEAAGIYPFTCTPHPLLGGRVSVPVRVTPRSAGVGERLTVTWATVDASGSRVYDVQLRRPRSTWEPWRMGVSELEGARSRRTPGPGDTASAPGSAIRRSARHRDGRSLRRSGSVGSVRLGPSAGPHVRSE